MRDLPLRLVIERGGTTVFDGETRTSQLKRPLEDIAKWLFAELDFSEGAFLMTGTGLVPPDEFTLKPGDAVRIALGDLVLENKTWWRKAAAAGAARPHAAAHSRLRARRRPTHGIRG